jgi:hypothetical protein
MPSANSHVLRHAAKRDVGEHEFAWPIRALIAANSVALAWTALLPHPLTAAQAIGLAERWLAAPWRLPE